MPRPGMLPAATRDWSAWEWILVQAPALSGNAGLLPPRRLFPPERSPASCDNLHPKGEATVRSCKPGWQCLVPLSPAAHGLVRNGRESDRAVRLLPFGSERLLHHSGPFGPEDCPRRLEHRGRLVAWIRPSHNAELLRPPDLSLKEPCRDCIQHPTSRAAFARQTDNEQWRRRFRLSRREQDRDSCGPSKIRGFLPECCAKA